MKTCTYCKTEKPVDEFSFKDKEKSKRHSWCRACHKVYKDNHYKNNRQSYIDKAAIVNKKLDAMVRSEILNYLRDHPCVDCGETDPVVLDFDHIDPSVKEFNVSTMIMQRYTWNKIFAEISKCQIRCANCHRRRTAKQFGSYRLSI